MALEKIQERDQTLLCASFYFNSFKRVVEELVYNSFDAESNSIAIRVCIENNFIQVLDNGIGITKENFRHLGDKYVTSKSIDITCLKPRPNKYGFKGISLASIIQISQNVKISSKCQNSQETWMKTFCNGSVKEFCLTTSRPSKGTTIEISGFLYNLSIQQKSIDLLNEISNIILCLEQLSLVHCDVSLSVRDNSKNEIVFKIHKNRTIYQTLWSLFEINRNNIQDLQVEKNQYKVKAYVAKNSLISNKYQWIYLNGRIVFKSILHKKLNETFTKKLSIKTTNKPKEKHKHTNENDFNSKIPSYFIFISCPYFDYDIYYDNKQIFIEFKNFDEIDKLIKKLVSFYCGDVNLIPVNVREEVNKNCKDTRAKVKELMEKILKKNENKAKISQLQNGIKGRNIKRKFKKNVAENTLQRILEKKSKDSSFKIKKTKFTKEPDHKLLTKFNIPNDLKDKKFKHLSNNNDINLPKAKQTNKKLKMVHKPQANNKSLIKNFEQQTETVRRRCQKLSCEVKSLLDRKCFYNHRIFETDYIRNVDLKSNETEKVFQMETIRSVFRHSKEINANIFVQKDKDTIKNSSMKQFKTSYDLLKTIENVEIPYMNINNKRTIIRESYFTCKKNNSDLTFDSHMREGIHKNIRQHINNGTSHENSYNLNSILNKSVFHTQNQSKERRDRISSHHTVSQTEIATKFKAFSEVDCSNDNNKKALNQNIYSNNMSININIESNKNSISQNNTPYDSDKINVTKNLNYNINFNFENTYTIDPLNSLHYNNGGNETYSIQMSTNLCYSNHITKKSTVSDRDTDSRKKEKDNLFKSQSNKVIEPLVHCEAILNSNEFHEIDKDFNNSFLDNGKMNFVDNFTLENRSQYFCDDKYTNDVTLENKDKSEELYSVEKVPNNQVFKNLTHLDSSLQPFNNDVTDIDNFKFKSRPSFIPKGMSQILENKFHRNINYNIEEEYYEDAIYKHFADDVLNKFKIFEPNVKNIKEIVLKDLNRANDQTNKDNSNLIFKSESLADAKILGQVDRKFIAAKIKNRCTETGKALEFLTFFDQHATDERIRLERNLSDYFNGIEWKSISLEKFKLKLDKKDFLYLYNYKEKFSQFGLQWTFTDNGILIHAIPKAILGKNPRKAEVIFEAIKRLISELIEVIKSLRGNVSLYPKSIMELIFSEACRYAIKFGDKLSKNDCMDMISDLASCKTPFQCAHGRPVMAIITELPNNNYDYMISLNSVKMFKKRFSIV